MYRHIKNFMTVALLKAGDVHKIPDNQLVQANADFVLLKRGQELTVLFKEWAILSNLRQQLGNGPALSNVIAGTADSLALARAYVKATISGTGKATKITVYEAGGSARTWDLFRRNVSPVGCVVVVDDVEPRRKPANKGITYYDYATA
jgi:hypothetical protein